MESVFKAAVISIPLAFAIGFSASDVASIFKEDVQPVKLDIEHMSENERKEYISYLKYDSCVKNVSRVSNGNNIDHNLKSCEILLNSDNSEI